MSALYIEVRFEVSSIVSLHQYDEQYFVALLNVLEQIVIEHVVRC